MDIESVYRQYFKDVFLYLRKPVRGCRHGGGDCAGDVYESAEISGFF